MFYVPTGELAPFFDESELIVSVWSDHSEISIIVVVIFVLFILREIRLAFF